LLSDLFEAEGRAPGPAPAWTAGLHALAARGYEVTLLHVLAPEEVEPGLAGDLKLLDSETGAAVEVTADAGLLARYRRGLAAWREELGRFCGARGMHYVPIETTLPIEDLLFAWLRQRGVLR
jgi:hypothetical protein